MYLIKPRFQKIEKKTLKMKEGNPHLAHGENKNNEEGSPTSVEVAGWREKRETPTLLTERIKTTKREAPP